VIEIDDGGDWGGDDDGRADNNDGDMMMMMEAEHTLPLEPPDCQNEFMGKEGVVGKEVSKEKDTNNASTDNILPPDPPYLDDPNIVLGKDSKEGSKEEDTNNASTDNILPPELPSLVDDQNKCADKEGVVDNEDPEMDSKQDASTSDCANVVVAQVCSVKLPTMENLEVAARLSAFDSFLFLADGYTGNWNETHLKKARIPATNHGVGEGLTRRIQHGDDNDTNTMVEGTTATTEAASTAVALAAAKPTESKEQEPTQPNANSNTNSIRPNNNDNAISKVIQQLIQQRQTSLQWPVVKVLPGTTEVLVKKKQPPFRMVPLEEQIVRTVPGGGKERKELMKRLGAFDDYLFLVDG